MTDVKGLFEQKYGCAISACLADLEPMLAEVKTLYNEKYSHDEKLQALEASMTDVKGLFEQKYGCDISFMDDDGAQWTCNDAEAAVDPCKANGDSARRMVGLEAQLSEVEALYSAKYGATDEREEQDEDGTRGF